MLFQFINYKCMKNVLIKNNFLKKPVRFVLNVDPEGGGGTRVPKDPLATFLTQSGIIHLRCPTFRGEGECEVLWHSLRKFLISVKFCGRVLL